MESELKMRGCKALLGESKRERERERAREEEREKRWKARKRKSEGDKEKESWCKNVSAECTKPKAPGTCTEHGRNTG